MSVWRRRFWDTYNIVIFVVAIGFGVLTLTGGGTRNLVTGLGLIAVSGWLLVRVVRLQRQRRGAGQNPSVARISHLELGPEAVQVLSGTTDRPGRAVLSWPDCVAVVASPTHGSAQYYVHFMAASDDCVLLEGVSVKELRQLGALTGQPVSPALGTVWLFGAESLPEVAAILDAVGRCAPHARIIDSINRG